MRAFRRQLLINLEDYILEKHLYTSRGRVGEILLILPMLQSIALQFVEQVKLAVLVGALKIDNLLQEMLLEDNNNSTNDLKRIMEVEQTDSISRIVDEIVSWPLEEMPLEFSNLDEDQFINDLFESEELLKL